MNWDLLDILTFGAMVAVLTVIIWAARSRSPTRDYRVAATVAAVGAFLLVWVNGAVGIIGNEENDANLLFFGVLAIAVAGSALARFRAKGMAIAFFATAGAQLLVAVFALAMRLGESSPAWPRGLLVLTAAFCSFWLVTGWLFGRAASKEGGAVSG